MSPRTTDPQPAPPQDIKVTWHSVSADEALVKLETERSVGLSAVEVEKRLAGVRTEPTHRKTTPIFSQACF